MATSPRFTPGVNQDNTYRAVTQDYQSPAYASAIAITTTQQVTLIKVGTLTGTLSLTINTGDGVDAPFVGDKVQFLFAADGSGAHVVTFSTGFAPSDTLSVAASKYATARFIFNGTVWVEESVIATA